MKLKSIESTWDQWTRCTVCSINLCTMGYGLHVGCEITLSGEKQELYSLTPLVPFMSDVTVTSCSLRSRKLFLTQPQFSEQTHKLYFYPNASSSSGNGCNDNYVHVHVPGCVFSNPIGIPIRLWASLRSREEVLFDMLPRAFVCI